MYMLHVFGYLYIIWPCFRELTKTVHNDSVRRINIGKDNSKTKPKIILNCCIN